MAAHTAWGAALVGVVALVTAACKDSAPNGASESAATAQAPADIALPGVEPVSRALYQRMRQATAARGGPAHTRHLRPDGSPRYTNRLIFEASPYLQQHAHNPVNWYPWGDAALARARSLDRPILLSIGYSTCHWCHVMEEESFEDEEIARQINQGFVAIKVDREERPDLDAIFMTAVQLISGGGGWPMTLFLTPSGEPIFATTYVPPRAGVRGARIGLSELLERVRSAWTDQRQEVISGAGKLRDAMRAALAPRAAGDVVDAATAMGKAASSWRAQYDPVWGGLGTDPDRPKFPSSLPVRTALRYARRAGSGELRDMALTTLRKMAAGGIHDQVGGGFHRYATDRKWLVPHFEEMLYGNALLVQAYLDGYQVSGDPTLAAVAREILRYLRRDMAAPDGGFYAATDADSPTPGGGRAEGAFFLWTRDELEQLLGDDAPLVADWFGVSSGPNFGDANILWTPRPLADVAAEHHLTEAAARAVIDRATDRLYQRRAQRPPPPRDGKILAGWNGLALSAFARAARVLGDDTDGGAAYLDQAKTVAALLTGPMVEGGRLRRSIIGGRARMAAYLEDYAFVIAGLIDLFEASGEVTWLAHARALDRVLAAHYADPDAGGFFRTADDQEKLLARDKPGDDGSLPSGNAVAAMNLLRLYQLTGEDDYRRRADRTLAAFAGPLRDRPGAVADLLAALDYADDRVLEVVIVTPERRAQAEPMLAQLRAVYAPSLELVVVPAAKVNAVAAQAPIVAGKRLLHGLVTAYVCQDRRCELPTTDPARFRRQISAVARYRPAPATPR